MVLKEPQNTGEVRRLSVVGHVLCVSERKRRKVVMRNCVEFSPVLTVHALCLFISKLSSSSSSP